MYHTMAYRKLRLAFQGLGQKLGQEGHPLENSEGCSLKRKMRTDSRSIQRRELLYFEPEIYLFQSLEISSRGYQ